MDTEMDFYVILGTKNHFQSLKNVKKNKKLFLVYWPYKNKRWVDLIYQLWQNGKLPLPP